MPSKNTIHIQKILENNGPMLTSELAATYQKNNVCSNDVARKAISRAMPLLGKENITFSNKQTFVYNKKTHHDSIYYKQLLGAIKNHAQRHYEIITIMLSQKGYVSVDDLACYVAAPISALKGHKKFNAIIKELLDSNIIFLDQSTQYYNLHNIFHRYEQDHKQYAVALEVIRKVIIDDFTKLSKNINLVSYNTVKTNSEFAKFQWGYSAPCYIISELCQRTNQNKDKPAFIIADSLYLQQVGISDINFFINKLNIIKKMKIPTFIPVILTGEITSDAFDLLKKNKVVIALINELFGEKYTRLLQEIINVFTNTIDIVKVSSEDISKIFKSIEKLAGKYNDIKGKMFELAVSRYYFCQGSRDILMNIKIFRDNIKDKIDRGKKIEHEIDLLVIKDNTAIIVETKATNGKLTLDFVEKWLTEKINKIYIWCIDNYHVKSVKFQLWSIGGFDTNALDLLNTAKDTTKKYEIEYLDLTKIKFLAKDDHEFMANLKIILNVSKK